MTKPHKSNEQTQNTWVDVVYTHILQKLLSFLSENSIYFWEIDGNMSERFFLMWVLFLYLQSFGTRTPPTPSKFPFICINTKNHLFSSKPLIWPKQGPNSNTLWISFLGMPTTVHQITKRHKSNDNTWVDVVYTYILQKLQSFLSENSIYLWENDGNPNNKILLMWVLFFFTGNSKEVWGEGNANILVDKRWCCSWEACGSQSWWDQEKDWNPSPIQHWFCGLTSKPTCIMWLFCCTFSINLCAIQLGFWGTLLCPLWFLFMQKLYVKKGWFVFTQFFIFCGWLSHKESCQTNLSIRILPSCKNWLFFLEIFWSRLTFPRVTFYVKTWSLVGQVGSFCNWKRPLCPLWVRVHERPTKTSLVQLNLKNRPINWIQYNLMFDSFIGS